MWKLVVGFLIFAAISLFVIMKAGDKVDMSGEKHGTEATAHDTGHTPASAPAAAPVPAAAPAPAASAQ